MLRVAVVNFDDNDFQQIQIYLNLEGLDCDVERASFRQHLEGEFPLDGFDLALIHDIDTVEETSSLIHSIKQQHPHLPVFIISQIPDEFHGIRLLNWGADRVLSMEKLGQTLPDCLAAYFGELTRTDHRSVNEPYVSYELPLSLRRLQSKLEKTIGTPNFLESILNTIASVVIVLDFDGNIIFINHRAELISGYTFEEIQGRNFKDLFLLPEEEENIIRAFDESRFENPPSQHQNSWLTRSGTVKRLEWTNTVVEDKENGSAFIIGMGVDITEDFEKARALRVSEERFSKIFHANPSGMAIIDYHDGRVVDANQRFLGLLNMRLETVIGKSLGELGLLHPQDDWGTDFLLKIQQTAVFTVERKMMSPGNRVNYVMLAFNIVEMNSEAFILMTIQNLTDRILGEEQTRKFNLELEDGILERSAALEAINRELQSEIAFRKALESSTQRLIQIIWETPDIVAMADLHGQVQYLNKAGRLVIGLSETDPVSHLSIYSVYSDEFKAYIRSYVAPYIEAHGVWHGETEFYLPDGRVIPVSQVIIGHRDVNDEIQFYSSVARDITDLRQSSEELRKAYEKEKELGRLRASFFSMTSHQFRTPLSTIFSSSELIEHYGHLWTAEKRQVHTRRIQDSTMRLSQMLNDILEYSKIEARQGYIQVEGLNLEDLCLKIMNDLILADHENHRFKIHCGIVPCMVYSDRLSVELVVENLFSNAIKYSPAGTQVTVLIEGEEGMASLRVRDEGIGIPPTDQEMIFEPFHRGSNVVDTPGSGLGLMIVRKCLELIRGEISVRSGLGQGTEITILIPDLRGNW
jgi:PAS domain S-box-containing protein